MGIRAERQLLPWAPLLALLASGCEDPAEPLDGGYPLELSMTADSLPLIARDPCWRHEKGGWHFSTGHCEEMGPQAEMSGVYVAGFEEKSYFPDAAAIPDPYDRRRHTIHLELDEERLRRKAGPVRARGYPAVYRVTFAGRRTRYPVSVDCYGNPHFVFVADRLMSARYLGTMGAWNAERALALAKLRQKQVRRRHGGRWGELEQRAIESCGSD